MTGKTSSMKTEFSDIYNKILEISRTIKGISYQYTKEEDFRNINNISESQLVYWIEIVQRMHVCGVTSLQRLLKWLHSLDISWKNENYYGFCSSLRGLIEACSDTFHTSGKVCYTIADHFIMIEKALRGEATGFLISKEIEDELIHFMFARRLNKAEKTTQPNSHNTLLVTNYLKSLESDDVNLLYSELCQVSHPSMMSLAPFLLSNKENSLLLHMANVDKELNQDLFKRYRLTILDTLKIAVISSVCLLKIINCFKADVTESLRIDKNVLEFVDLHPYWIKILEKIRNSRSKI